jgi:hypothetical protein
MTKEQYEMLMEALVEDLIRNQEAYMEEEMDEQKYYFEAAKIQAEMDELNREYYQLPF